MKKTLVALFALASCAMGVDYYSQFTSYNVASTVDTTGFDYSNNAVTVAVTLNINTIKNYFTEERVWVAAPTEENPDAGSWTSPSHMLVQVTGNNAMGVGTLVKDAAKEYFSAAWNNIIDYTPTGIDTDMGRSNLWEDATIASLVLSLDRTTGARVVFTMAYEDGTIFQTSGLASSVKSGSWNPAGLKLDTSAVESVGMYSGYLGEADAKSVGMQLVPEPTTATLSLLALAGLAARRRRK